MNDSFSVEDLCVNMWKQYSNEIMQCNQDESSSSSLFDKDLWFYFKSFFKNLLMTR